MDPIAGLAHRQPASRRRSPPPLAPPPLVDLPLWGVSPLDSRAAPRPCRASSLCLTRVCGLLVIGLRDIGRWPRIVTAWQQLHGTACLTCINAAPPVPPRPHAPMLRCPQQPAAIGAGVLSLPFAFRAAGWAGGLLLTAAVAAVEGFTMVSAAAAPTCSWGMHSSHAAAALMRLWRPPSSMLLRLRRPPPSMLLRLLPPPPPLLLLLTPAALPQSNQLRSTCLRVTPSGLGPKPTQTW